MCFIEKHKSHNCLAVSKVEDDLRKQMTDDIECMKRTLSVCKKMAEIQTRNRGKFNRNIEEVEREICQQAEKMKQRIDQEKTKILDELGSRKKEKLMEIDQVVDEIELYASFAESLVRYMEEVMNKGSSKQPHYTTGSVNCINWEPLTRPSMI